MKEIVKRIVAFVMVLLVTVTGIPQTADAKSVKKHFYVSPVSDMGTDNYNWKAGQRDVNGKLYDMLITAGDWYTGELASYYIIRYKENGKITKEKLPIKQKNSVLTMTSPKWTVADVGNYSCAIGYDGNYHIMCAANAPGEFISDWRNKTYYVLSKKGKVLKEFELCNNDFTKKIDEACIAAGFEMGEEHFTYAMSACGYQKNHLLLSCKMTYYPNPVVKGQDNKFETQYFIADYDYETDKINWVRSVAATAYAEQSLNPGSIIVKSGDSYDIVDKCYNGIRIADIKTGEEKLNLTLDSEKGWYDACYYNGTVYGAKDKGIYKYNTETKKWKKVCSLSSSDLKNLRASKKRPPSLHVINQKSFLLYGNKSIVEYDKKKLKVLRIDL